jgi:cysteine desulfuration protein SufE
MNIEQIMEDFELLDEWEDKYRYIIELGNALPPFPDELRTEATKVHGCVSQVWLFTTQKPNPAGGAPVLTFTGDSDAHIVRGLIAVLLALYSGRPADEILEIDGTAVIRKIGLQDQLTPQRSNGLASMLKRIHDEAASRLQSQTRDGKTET